MDVEGHASLRDAAARPPVLIDSAESLVELARRRGARSVDELVPLLPAALRARHVLVFESRSLQRATFVEPRVILRSDDARFLVAFNGDSAESGRAVLETIEFDGARRAFRLHELAFQDGSPSLSEANPARCLACHGEDPRPVWDTYPAWPGVYGERDGGLGREERSGFAAFLAHRAASPRYAALVGVEAVAERPSAEADAYEGRERLSRNASFGMSLQRLRTLAIARQIVAAPGFGRFAYALLAALDEQCLDLEAFVPSRLRARFARGLSGFEKDTEQANAGQRRAKAARMRDAEGPPVPGGVESLARLRYLVEEGLGVSTRGWTTALERDTFDFTAPRPVAAQLERELRDALARMDPAVGGLSRAPEVRDDYCTALRRLSLAALARAP